MSMLPQTQFNSYCLPPLLAAPKIAGLLGSGPSPAFTFSDPRLEQLSSDQRQRLFDAVTVLLEVATRFALAELNDNALRAAASLFARKLTGESAKRYQNPAHFRAEQDADLLDWLLKVEKRRNDHRRANDQSDGHGVGTPFLASASTQREVRHE